MARILFVTSRLPFPPKEGHQLRSWHLLKALADQHEVTLLSFARDDDDLAAAERMRPALAGLEVFPLPGKRAWPALAAALLRGTLGKEPFVAARYASQAMRKRIESLARGMDAVHFDMLPLMRYADAVPARVPVVYNAHNVEHQLLDARAGMHGNLLARLFLRLQVPRLLAFERQACRRAKLVLACSGTDAQALRPLAPGVRVAIVPNGVDLQGNVPTRTPPAKARLVFVGQMGWFPNRDGVEWFLREVFPRILMLRPEAEFVLVGKPGNLQVPADVASHVTLAGFVPDLRPVVHAASVYVVPLRAGSGTRLKVLEAMALGKAIVTTTIGSEGIVLRHGHSALYADDADEFARAVVSLLDAPEQCRRLGAAARTCAEDHYGWEAIGRDLLAFYEPLLPEVQPPAPIKAPAAKPARKRRARRKPATVRGADPER